MLNVKLVCVGNLKEAYLRDAVKEYEKRLGAYCRFTTAELKEDGQLPEAVNVKRAYKIALCVEGKQKSSEDFAKAIKTAAINGKSSIAFIDKQLKLPALKRCEAILRGRF